MDAKKCDRCGRYYDDNVKNETIGCVHGGVISSIIIIEKHGSADCDFDLCDDCIGELMSFLNINKSNNK